MAENFEIIPKEKVDKNLENRIMAIGECINKISLYEVKFTLEDIKKLPIDKQKALLDFYVDFLNQTLDSLKQELYKG